MSEFAFEPTEMLRPIGEVYDDLRVRASEMLGRVGARMGFGETAVPYSAEGEPANIIAEMAEDKKPDVEVKDEVKAKPDGTEVKVHTESLKPGSAGPGTGEGVPVEKNPK